MRIKRLKLKRNNYFILLMASFYAWFLPFRGLAYVLLEKLPSKSGPIQEIGLIDYLSWLYKFALSAAAFLAVLMIVIGGFQIVLGGASETQQKEGRERIKNAVFGLILALSAFLILYVINPELVNKSFNLKEINVVDDNTQSKDTTPPSVPGSLTATTINGKPQIRLTWSPSTDDTGVEGYVIMKGLIEWAKVQGTEYIFTGEPNEGYCFQVYAVDAAGNRSGLSKEACAKTGSSQSSEGAGNGNKGANNPLARSFSVSLMSVKVF